MKTKFPLLGLFISLFLLLGIVGEFHDQPSRGPIIDWLASGNIPRAWLIWLTVGAYIAGYFDRAD